MDIPYVSENILSRPRFPNVEKPSPTNPLILTKFSHGDLNKSANNVSIETGPTVCLKKTSSNVFGLIPRNDGSNRINFPNLCFCSLKWCLMWSPSITWAWSWQLSTWCGSRSPRESEEEYEDWLVRLLRKCPEKLKAM